MFVLNRGRYRKASQRSMDDGRNQIRTRRFGHVSGACPARVGHAFGLAPPRPGPSLWHGQGHDPGRG
eukprot:scaffold431_cov334-Pavlova_lutheri.AAC.99